MIYGPEAEIVIKLLVAAFLGIMIGYEREIHKKPAGLRTHAIVCMGSALFAIISISFTGPGIDSTRIAAGVVMGIGFLGAGTIFSTKNEIHGLTTAADLWVMAAIGLAVGFGMYFTSIAAAIIVLLILTLGKTLEKEKIRKR